MKKILFLVVVVGVLLSGGRSAFSAVGNTDTRGVTGNNPPVVKSKPTFLQNPIESKNVQEILYLAVDLAVFIGTIIAVLMFIWIGFKFVLAQGDPAGLQKAKKWFLYAVIGTAVLISSKVIVEVVKNTLISAGVVNEKQFKP